MKPAKFPSKWLVIGAMDVFLGTAFLIIALNSRLFHHGFHIDITISRYVGLEPWSAIIFFLSNIFVAIFIGRYLFKLGEAWQMPKIFYILVVVMAAALMGLSAFPIGLFDVDGMPPSIVSWMHQITSRTMFIMMLAISAMIVICRHANTLAHIANVIYIIFAVIFVVGFLTEAPWFLDYVLIYETTYLAGFMVAMMFCDRRRENLLQQVNLD